MIKEKILKLVDPFIRLPLVGLDISDTSIKYLKFRSDGKLDFEFFGEISVPEGIIIDGEIKREEDFVRNLRSWLARDGRFLRSSFVVASLPEEKSFLRAIQLPKVGGQDLTNAVRWEIEANIPLSPEELSYDHEVTVPLEDHLDHFDVTVTAFPKSITETYTRVLKLAGLNPVVLELESQAMIRSLVVDLRSRSSRIVVDMGRNRTSFTIFSGGAIIFTTTIKLGGRTLEENIVRALNVDEAKAVVIKKEVGLNKKEYDGKVFSALVSAVSVLADELSRTIEYYRGYVKHRHGASEEIEEIILAGGDANLFGLATYLASTLRVPIRIGDPLSVIKDRLATPFPPFPKNQALAYATVIGLALRGIR